MHFPTYPLKLVIVDQGFIFVVPQSFWICIDDFLDPWQFFFQVQNLIHLLLIFRNNH